MSSAIENVADPSLAVRARKSNGTEPPDFDEIPISAYEEDARRAGRSMVAVSREPLPKPERRPLDFRALSGRIPPQREWIIDHWLSASPTLFAGRGGIGKTLLAQMIATALALGIEFIDRVTRPFVVLFWSCEDDHDEMWRRQVEICRYFKVEISDLHGKLVIEPRLGLDNTLFDAAFNRPMVTPLIEELSGQLNDYKADVLFLDNIAQTFGGNESDRHHVTRFLTEIVGTVRGRPFAPVLLAHPAKLKDSEYSGSTAWENACRMRWYLGDKLPDQDQNDEEPADDVRFLCKRKANYTTKDYRRFTYQNGVLVPDQVELGIGGVVDSIRRHNHEKTILEGIVKCQEMGLHPTDGKSSPDYLPRALVDKRLNNGATKHELTNAMHRLMGDGKLKRGEVGRYANRNPRLGLIVVG